MTLDMTPEQRETGKANFERAVDRLAFQDETSAPAATTRRGLTRRSFMRGLLAGGATLPIAAAAYFGYTRLHGRPVRAGLIGAGDEGGVLVGEHNPEFLEFIACSDVRPSNKHRIFVGEPNRGGPLWRCGFNHKYGSNSQQRIRWYDNYRDLLANPDIEMVVIALPLHLHAEASIAAMRAGKHVLCEKLMGRTIAQCKEMIRVSDETDKLLAIGHQRHYSLLYAQVLELIHSGVLGDIKHIRALWHRNQSRNDSWRKPIPAEDRQALTPERVRELGYSSIEELCQWRLYRRTGGGLMAELGSHQLDACSIFLGKKHPLAVSGTGLKSYFNDNREIEDQVFCNFEFPGKAYDAEKPLRDSHGVPQYNDVVNVSYSSISTNGFESYGECIMGTRGTLVVQTESDAMLYGEAVARSTQMTVVTQPSGQPALDSWGSGPAPAAGQTAAARPAGVTYSRGYREEMEHFAYCLRMRNEGMARDREDLTPRCHGRAAMADAIIALASNQAFSTPERVKFEEAWFTDNPQAVPGWDARSDRV
jgi:predicted dehydrogenase